MTGAGAGARNVAATEAVMATWGDDPVITDPRWDDVGIGEAACPDGRLYVSAAFTQRPTMPATARYSSPVHSSSQITTTHARLGGRVDQLPPAPG